MATAPATLVLKLGPASAGVALTGEEFDAADFEEGWRYELINGVLVVSPPPLEQERDPNEQLGHWLRTYQESHPNGAVLDATLPEHIIVTGENRRRVDRAIWCGLGRLPTESDIPAIAVEFVSEGRANIRRDYELKRDEYLSAGVREYWVIDRFRRTMTVFARRGDKMQPRVIPVGETYTTELLPGFDLPLSRLLALADRWTR